MDVRFGLFAEQQQPISDFLIHSRFVGEVMEVGMSLLMNGTSRERGLRGRGGHSNTGQGLLPSEISPPPTEPLFGQPPNGCCAFSLKLGNPACPAPRVPPVVIGGAHQRWRWRSHGSHHPSSLQRPVYRHHPPNILLCPRAGLCSAQNGLGTHPPTLDPDDQLQVHLWPSRTYPPPSRALLRDVHGFQVGG